MGREDSGWVGRASDAALDRDRGGANEKGDTPGGARLELLSLVQPAKTKVISDPD